MEIILEIEANMYFQGDSEPLCYKIYLNIWLNLVHLNIYPAYRKLHNDIRLD